ncbi:MAG TPA: ATP-binding protein, partial [Candidatus Sulfotelmatobacter sp.]|nr:ATP-binding protein [Candidatus Sulfotelmatobacter sp.]
MARAARVASSSARLASNGLTRWAPACLARRLPRVVFGIRFSLIAAMAVLLLLTVLAVGYTIVTLDRLRDATTRLASTSLPGLASAQRLADDVASLGEFLKAARAPRTAAEHRQRMANVQESVARVRARLGATSEVDATVEAEAIRARLTDQADALVGALGDLDLLLTRRIALMERQEALRRDIRAAYGDYMTAVDDANRQMRALVARTLAIDVPDALSEGHLQERLDAFQDREMSWLGTTQDLRSDGRELNATAEAAMAAAEPDTLNALLAHGTTVVLRMGLHKRLPDTPVVRVLATRTAEFTRYFPADPTRTPLASRAKEIELERQGTLLFASVQEIHEDLRREASRLVQALSGGTGVAVAQTNWMVARAKRYVLGFSLVAVLIAAVAIGHVVFGPVKRIEALTTAMLQAASETQRGRPSSIDTEMRASVGRAGPDEIAAMGEALLFFLGAIAQRDRARAEADRAAQDTLRTSEQRLRQIIDLVPHFIFAKDLDGRYILANRALAEFCGMSVDALIGRRDAEVPAIAAQAEQLHADDLAVIMSGQPKWILEDPMIDAAGRHRVLMTLKIPFSCSGTGAPAVLGVAEDITERQHAEQERTNLERQLWQAQKLESVGRLAGGVAHDFNNVLTIIRGYGQMLLGQTDLAGPARDHVQEILHAGERAAALIQRLLAFSRKQVLELRPVQLNEVVAGMDKLLRRVIGEDILLTTHLAAELPIVKADPTQLEQVILNLAVNARDAMPRGGGLSLETRAEVLDATYCQHHPDAQPGPFAMLMVSDTGVGMDQATMARIFEPFFTTKDKDKGTGLGLATVYGIVRQTGGHITVRSEEGRGTTFKIYLPAEPERPRSELGPQAQPDESALRGTETILLVEDDGQVRAITRRMLQQYGYAVVEAANGDEALQLSPQVSDSVTLLLTDVIMPGLNGPELAGRWVERYPRTKVLYMSGYTRGLVGHQDLLEGHVH